MGSSLNPNLHAPGPIGDVTPSTVQATRITKTGPIGNIILATDVDHGSVEAVYLGVVTPTASNYSAEGDGTTTKINGPSRLQLGVNDIPSVTLDGASCAFGVPIINQAFLVSGLPAAASFLYGRCFVSDAQPGAFDDVVLGGGSKAYPVHSDGVTWRIG